MLRTRLPRSPALLALPESRGRMHGWPFGSRCRGLEYAAMNDWIGPTTPAILDGDTRERSAAVVANDPALFKAATNVFIKAGAAVVRAPGVVGVTMCRSMVKDTRVWGVVEPLGKLLALKEAEADELAAHYRAEVEALEAVGPDAVLIDGLSDIDEALIACAAARTVTRRPVGVGFVFGGGADHDETVLGTSCVDVSARMRDSGATFLACTCQLPIDEMVLVVRLMCTDGALPVVAYPDAGQPELDGDDIVYRETPAEFADKAGSLVAAGALGIGGCCGVGPEHIAEVAATLAKPA